MILRRDNELQVCFNHKDGSDEWVEDFPRTLRIIPHCIAKTPRHIGAEIDMQDHADKTNLWDFIKDAKITMTRSRALDTGVRKLPEGESYDLEDYVKDISDHKSFLIWKQAFLKNPKQFVHKDSYNFMQKTGYEGGIPDQTVKNLLKIGVMPCIELSWCPKNFGKPLLKRWCLDGKFPSHDAIDWQAYANAYLNYYIVMNHFAGVFSCNYFMLSNEPFANDSYPNPEEPCGNVDISDYERKQKQFFAQLAVLAHSARAAIEDVKAGFSDKAFADSLFLSGFGSCGHAREIGLATRDFIDSVDFHHYCREAANFDRRYMGLQQIFNDKKLFCSEFNVRGGPVHPDYSFFTVNACLEFGALMMEVLEATDPAHPGMEAAMMYQFSYPASHRTFKSLVYGDMNYADWFYAKGRLKMMVKRPMEWYPTFEECQLRFQTMAYQLFRMLARCIPGDKKHSGYDVLGMHENFFPSVSPTRWDAVKFLTVKTDDSLIVNVLNPCGQRIAQDLRVSIAMIPENYKYAIVRRTNRFFDGDWNDDMVLSQELVKDKLVILKDIPSESFTQIIFTNVALDQIESLRVKEETFTKGGVNDGLSLYETTILVPYGNINGQYVNLADLNIVWESSEPDLVTVYQSGLVQRVRDTGRDVAITAKTVDGRVLSEAIVIKGNIEKK